MTTRFSRRPRRLTLGLAVAIVAVTGAAAQTGSTVRCSLNYAPDRACRMTDRVVGETHHMTFSGPGINVTFVARPQTGWWAGKLNGKPAMGYERNRGNVVISTYDLSTSFAWWYPQQAHGTY